ncbi:ferredoxin reductase family protein [Streptomyces avermitilis]|uniref:ferredoxin reductase family protein n=1 Tax=Streptomyces avermitilis TaxID=33903 RepID=UPI0033B3FD51
MLSGYAMVITVLLSARIPPLERALGQDRLIAWHRRLGSWGLYLLSAHAVLITVGYARAAKTGILAEISSLLWTYSGILSATVGSALLLAAGVTSYRRARSRMTYETWWAVHLYTYLGLGLSFVHQVDTGAPFVGHPLARAWWTSLWVGALVVVLAFRVGLPLWRSVRHDLRVAQVSPAGPNTWSIKLSGRHLERLPTAGGQFMMWRFLRRELWWQAHPYSLSAAPRAGHLRITVAELGDHSTALSRLAPVPGWRSRAPTGSSPLTPGSPETSCSSAPAWARPPSAPSSTTCPGTPTSSSCCEAGTPKASLTWTSSSAWSANATACCTR